MHNAERNEALAGAPHTAMTADEVTLFFAQCAEDDARAAAALDAFIAESDAFDAEHRALMAQTDLVLAATVRK